MFEPTPVAPPDAGRRLRRPGRVFQVKRKNRSEQQTSLLRLAWVGTRQAVAERLEMQAGAVPAIDRSVLESLNLRWRNTAFFARIERATRGSS
jgi:hypothetical protein